MSDPNLAARDPIFWLHHANIDRLWKHWLVQGDGRANPTDDAWATEAFTFFDENGTEVSLTGAEILDTVEDLGYRYDDEGTELALDPVERPATVGQMIAQEVGCTAPDAGVELRNETVRLAVPIDTGASDLIDHRATEGETPPRGSWVRDVTSIVKRLQSEGATESGQNISITFVPGRLNPPKGQEGIEATTVEAVSPLFFDSVQIATY